LFGACLGLAHVLVGEQCPLRQDMQTLPCRPNGVAGGKSKQVRGAAPILPPTAAASASSGSRPTPVRRRYGVGATAAPNTAVHHDVNLWPRLLRPSDDVLGIGVSYRTAGGLKEC
jgi:hypothetical protein